MCVKFALKCYLELTEYLSGRTHFDWDTEILQHYTCIRRVYTAHLIRADPGAD